MKEQFCFRHPVLFLLAVVVLFFVALYIVGTTCYYLFSWTI